MVYKSKTINLQAHLPGRLVNTFDADCARLGLTLQRLLLMALTVWLDLTDADKVKAFADSTKWLEQAGGS